MSQESNVATLVTNKTDAEKAAAYRVRLTPLLEQVAAIVQEAKNDGLIVNFNISADNYGRIKINAIDIVRPL